MDLDLLHHHARRYGKWSMNITPTDRLECHYRHNVNRDSKWYYSYWLYKGTHGVQIDARWADQLIEMLFARDMA